MSIKVKEHQAVHVKNRFTGKRPTLISYIHGLTDTLATQVFLTATFGSLFHSLLISF